MLLLVKLICGFFILVVVLSGVALPQCMQPDMTPIGLYLFGRNTEENQITLRCRWCSNFSDIQDPHLFVNSTDNPVQFRLKNGLLSFNISQELEGYYYCGASPNNISSNRVTLIAYPRPNSSIPTQHSVEVGQTITIDCPVAVGALRGLYSFSWRKGLRTVNTTGPETQYSVDPLNKALTIANIQLDNNGTYYCDVTISVPGVNPYFVPSTKITLFVTAPFSLVVIVGVFLAVFVPAFCVFIYMGSVMVISRQCSQRRHKERREAANTAETREAIKARFKSSQSLLEKALKRGFVETPTVLCLLTGVAGSGKTHTKHLLFRKNPPEDRTSTPLAERPVQAVIVCETSEQFQEVSIDELDKVLANEIAAGVQLENRTSLLCPTCFGNTVEGGVGPQSRLHSTPLSIPTLHTPHYRALSSEFTPHNQRTWCCSMCHEPESEHQEATRLELDNTLHLMMTSTKRQQLLSGKLIYLIDSGGQIEFLEVLPAFLQNMSVCLFIMKLSERLSDYPKIEYFEDGKSVGEPTPCTLTNEEMLMRCVQTIQSQRVLTDGNANEASKVVVVGTHRDLENSCPESREEKNQKLLSQLSPAFDQILLFHGQEMKEIIFPINAKNPDSQDHQVATELTNVISKAASRMEPRKTPISWFKFEHYLQKLAHDQGTRILHRKECLEIAQLLHLSRKDFDAALDHLASYCVIHYYRHLLPNVVFIDPQFLPGKISELVKYHYTIRCHPHRHTGTEGELRKFRNEACITIKLLKQFPEGYTAFFTPADLLRLMKDRLIVAQHISNDEYFMPCLLPTMESDKIEQCRQTSSSSPAAALAIVFSHQCRWVPHGIFCSLVAFLQSSENSSWRLSVCPNDSTKPLCLTRNCIKFQFPEGVPGTITLVDAFSHFEVYIDAPRDACVALCPSIWDTLFSGIEKSKETLKYRALEKPKQAFLCKHGSDCYTRPLHLAFPADKLNYWKCEIDPGTMYGCLSEENMVWFPKLRGLSAPSENVLSFPASDDEVLPSPPPPVLPSPPPPVLPSPPPPSSTAATGLGTAHPKIALPFPPLSSSAAATGSGTARPRIGNRPEMWQLQSFVGVGGRSIRVVENVCADWEELAVALQFSGGVIRAVKRSQHFQAEDACWAILQRWLDGHGESKQPVTWKTLVECLECIRHGSLASDLRRELQS